jgi:hypothetical protein
VLAVTTLLATGVACGRTEGDAAEATRRGNPEGRKGLSGDFIDYERPQISNDTEWWRTTAAFEEKTRLSFDPAVLVKTRWRLRSVDGAEPVEGSIPTVGFGKGQEASR